MMISIWIIVKLGTPEMTQFNKEVVDEHQRT